MMTVTLNSTSWTADDSRSEKEGKIATEDELRTE
jgi:hypothetical protein